MARRGPYKKRGFKLKLKNSTIYSLFSFGLLATAGLVILSFTGSGESLVLINDLLMENIGWTTLLLPFVLIFFAFLFLRLKFFLSRANVAIGFLFIFLSLTALTKSGVLGDQLFFFFEDLLTSAGTYLLFLAAFLVGIIVLFDTSVDQIIDSVVFTFKNIHRLFPVQSLSKFGKNSKDNLLEKNPPLQIRGGQRPIPSEETAANNQKKDVLISDELVSNKPMVDGIWEYPPLSLLSEISDQKADRGDVKQVASVIEQTLESFGIRARVVEVNLGPAVTQYALKMDVGTKVSKILALSNDLALATEAPTGQIRIEAPIPGRNLVGIEIPNRSLEVVTLKTMLSSQVMQKSKSKTTVSMGLDVSGNPVVADIAKMPHVLIAGTTGSGKSVMINNFICSLLFRGSPSEVKLILIDPKRVELTSYNGIPHLLTPVIVETEKILSALKWAMGEMDKRYKIFAERGVRNIESYNELSGFQALPYIVIFIDELADLMAFAPVEVEDTIARLAQMARATGIHLVVSTQRPSVDVLTGLIKANIPCRIAFNVSSMIDSRVIIDQPGAEKLLGRGDMLYIPPDQAKPTRIQGAFVSDKEVRKLVEFLKSKVPEVEYTEEVTSQQVNLKKPGMPSMGADGRDPLFEEAVRIVCQYDRASASLLQRRLSVGYSRAARILDQLEAMGAVGHAEGSKPRDVLVTNPDEYMAQLQNS